MTDDEIDQEIERLTNERDAFNKALQNELDSVSDNIWVKNGVPIKGLAERHEYAVQRSEEISDAIDRLQDMKKRD